MNVFDFTNYKIYVAKKIESMPKKGYGQLKKIAEHLNISSVIVTQVFNGERELTMEQAFELCDYFALNELEKEYFLLLVQKERAGTHQYKLSLQKKLDEVKIKSQNLKDRMPAEQNLSDEQKAVFYSAWYYSAVRLSTGLAHLNSVEAISEYLHLPKMTVKRAVDFLTQHSLVLETEKGLKVGPKSTHIGAGSALVARHHNNWRTRAIEKLDSITSEELFFTCPMALDPDHFAKIRKVLVDTIAQIDDIIDASPSKELGCLNIDLFKLKKD